MVEDWNQLAAWTFYGGYHQNMGKLLMEEILNHLLVTIGNYWEL